MHVSGHELEKVHMCFHEGDQEGDQEDNQEGNQGGWLAKAHN